MSLFVAALSLFRLLLLFDGAAVSSSVNLPQPSSASASSKPPLPPTLTNVFLFYCCVLFCCRVISHLSSGGGHPAHRIRHRCRCCCGHCLCRRRCHLPLPLPVICLIVVCIATESATISSSSVFVSLQPSFLLPTRSGRFSLSLSAVAVVTIVVRCAIAIVGHNGLDERPRAGGKKCVSLNTPSTLAIPFLCRHSTASSSLWNIMFW